MKFLVAVLPFLISVACTGGSSGSPGSSPQVKAETAGPCSAELRACVGDPIQVPAPESAAKTRIAEIVPAGQIAAREQKMLDQAGPQRAELEKYYHDIGLRIYTDGSGQEATGPYFGNLLAGTYVIKGCLTPGHLCLGDNNYIWLGYQVVHQTILGFALNLSAKHPVLVEDRELDNLGVEFASVDDLGDGLLDKGCATMTNPSHKFCVGEKYSDENGESLVIYIGADSKNPVVILKNAASGKESRLQASP